MLDPNENALVPDDFRFYRAERPAAKIILDGLPLRSSGKVSSKLVYVPSGFGKTSTGFAVGREVFAFYLACTPGRTGEATSTKSGEDFNTSFPNYMQRVDQELGQGFVSADTQKYTNIALRLSSAYILSHVFVLHLFLGTFPGATPYQFLRFQISAIGASLVAAVFRELAGYTDKALAVLGVHLRLALAPVLDARGQTKTCLFIIDEMEGVLDHKSTYFLSTNGKEGRGLLSPLLQALRARADDCLFSIVACGTGELLSRSESILSDIGKGSSRLDVAAFPLASEDDVVNILHNATGLSRAVLLGRIPEIGRVLVGGRFRLTTRAARTFINKKPAQPTEEAGVQVLSEAVDESVENHTTRLKELLSSFVNDPVAARSLPRLETLLQIYVAGRFSAGRIPVTTSDDLCAVGVAASVAAGQFAVEETYALDGIGSWFEANPELANKTAFRGAVANIEAVVKARGGAVAGKGDMFENVLIHALTGASLRGPVLALPFLQLSDDQRAQLQSVWGETEFAISDAVTSVDEKATTAADFLVQHVNCLMPPEKTHRADLLANLDNVALFECACKFYSSAVPSEDVLAQFRATDPRLAYYIAAGTALNTNAAARRLPWDAAQFPSRPVLRVHVSIPRAQKPLKLSAEVYQYGAGTYVLDARTIVVNLDASNLHLLLGKPKGNGPEDEVLRALYGILFFVTKSEEFVV